MLRVESQYFGRRLLFAGLFAGLLLAVLIIRLWYLQWVNGAYFRDLSENNRTRTVRSLAPRGSIYDREGRVLVTNRPAFNVELMLEDTPDVEKTLRRLARLMNLDWKVLEMQLRAQDLRRHFEPKLLIADVNREDVAKIKANLYRLPGLIISAVPTREYPFRTAASQLFGYSREISRAQLSSAPPGKYRQGDIVGQTGLEKHWDKHLRGKNGYVQVEVDARGNRRGELGIEDPKKGGDVYLTIDLDLQLAAEAALEGKKGAVVAMDPNTGEILTLASAPSFDANLFSGKMLAQDWDSVTKGKDHPLTNRAIASAFPPGSTFKLIAAFAGLAEKKINENTTYFCPGFFMFGGRPYHCHKHSGHGNVNLAQAIARSCNAYFYRLGQELQIAGIHKYGELLNLGQKTGIGLPGEKSGTLPSEAWKRKRLGDRWYPGDTIPVSIGQGYLTVTPLQLLVAVTAIANNGSVFRPALVKKLVSADTKQEQTFEPKIVKRIEVDPKVFADVRNFSAGVVNGEGGTGSRAKIAGITVGGKTGTAQVTALGRGGNNALLKDHAWFVSFAPVENPMIAMVVLVENAGMGGGMAAAPISKQVMEVFFKKKNMLVEEVPATPPSGEEKTPSVTPAPTSVPTTALDPANTSED